MSLLILQLPIVTTGLNVADSTKKKLRAQDMRATRSTFLQSYTIRLEAIAGVWALIHDHAPTNQPTPSDQRSRLPDYSTLSAWTHQDLHESSRTLSGDEPIASPKPTPTDLYYLTIPLDCVRLTLPQKLYHELYLKTHPTCHI
ncbi:hypothetical protein OG21DRAFT_1491783 [Imleria badia]|nr:hypothetical protein OG21DRAFT_1491783 [Imleria badia]